MNIISQSKSFSKLPPNPKAQTIPKNNNKELSNQISSLISIELSRLDTDDILSEFNTLFPYQTTTQSSYIISLTSTISNIKQSTITSVSNFLSSYKSFNSNNQNYIAKEEEYITMIFSINTEIKNLIKQSKIKFKQNKDFASTLEFNLNVISENIKKGKWELAMERFVKVEENKKDIEMNMIYIEEYQKKFYDNVKNIIKNTATEIPSKIISDSPSTKKATSSIKKTSFMKYSSNGKQLTKNTSESKNSRSKSKTIEVTKTTNDDALLMMKEKNKVLNKEISSLKRLLKNEQEMKNQVQSELNKYKQKSFASTEQLNNGTRSKSNIKQDLQMENLSKRIQCLSEMIMSFSLSMNSLRDSLLRKSINVIDIQNDYKNLTKKFQYLTSATFSLKNKIYKFSEDHYSKDKKCYRGVDSSSNIKIHNQTSEFNNISSIMDASGEFSNSFNMNNNNNNNTSTNNHIHINNEYNNENSNNEDTLTQVMENEKNKEEKKDYHGNKYVGNSLKQLSNIVITFRNDEPNQKEQCGFSDNEKSSPIREEVTKNETSNSMVNVEELINENKNLKSQLASQMLLNSSQAEIEQLKSELSMAEAKIKELNQSNINSNNNKDKLLDGILKKELIELKEKYEKNIKSSKEIIEEKNKEIELLKQEKQNSNESMFNNLVDNYNTNMVNLRKSYEEILDEKNKKIDELNIEIISLNQKINEINSKLYSTQNDKRTQNIMKEASLSNLENEKVSLEIKIEQLENELLKYKNTQIGIENSSKENDLALSTQIDNLNFKIKNLNTIIESKTKIIESLQSKTKAENESNSSLIDQLNSKISSLQKEVVEKDKKNLKLQEETIDKNKQIENITLNYQNDLNELNTSIILLKSKISKLQEENITLSYSQRCLTYQNTIQNEIDFIIEKDNSKETEIEKLKKEITTLKTQISEDNCTNRTEKQISQSYSILNQENISVLIPSSEKEYNSNRQINKQKEELSVLKVKLRSTLEENKKLTEQVNELQFFAKKEKEEYMDVLRSAFEKFLNETQITNKNKEFTTILLKMMNYTDEDIQNIYNVFCKKKEKGGGGVFGFLRK